VDDAIIDVENVLRRLKENASLPEPQRKTLVEVIYTASNEIRSSVVFATIIICIVFVPLLFLQGLEGRFFQPLGIAYIISIMASLIVALTVTPALCKWLFAGAFGKKGGRSGESSGHGEHDGWLVRWLKRRYEPLLRASVRNRGLVLGGAGVLTVASLLLMSTFGTSFLPAFKEGTFTVFLLAPPGTSLVESNRLATGVEAQMAQIEGVSSVTRRTGRAERDEHAEPVSSSEIEVTMKAGVDQDRVRAAIDRIIANIPGITTMVGQPIEHRLSHVLSGTPAAIAINVYGDDLNVLRSLAKEIEAAIKPIPGTRDVAANREIMITSLPIRYRPQDLVAAGLSPASAAEQVQHLAQAVGVNCTHPSHVGSLLRRMALATTLPLVAYPNHGAEWDAEHKCWIGTADGTDLPGHLDEWLAAGARLVGGCCGVGTKGIAALAAARAHH